MKKIIKTIFTWIFIQLYITLAVIFLSKQHLFRIAQHTGNHPLIVFHSSRWMRIWWVAWFLIALWGVFAWPFLNLILFGSSHTAYSQFTPQDEVIFFGKYTIKFGYYWMITVLSGKLLTLFELVVFNKMEYFRRFIRRDNIVKVSTKKESLSSAQKQLS